MKVLFISRLYPSSYDPRNGAVMHRQAKELMTHGVEVQVVSPIPIVPKLLKSKRKKWQEYYSLPSSRIHEGIKIWHPKFLDLPIKSFDIYRELSIIHSVKVLINEIYSEFKFDLIHSHMGFPDSSLGVYLKDKYGVPLITTVRSTDTEISLKRKRVKPKLKYNLDQSDIIIAPSLQISEKINKLLNLPTKHIGNGIYPFKIEQMNKVEYQEKKIILSISNLIESKGIQYNILALKELLEKDENIIYIVVGDGPFLKELKDIVNDNGLNRHVIFAGNLSHEKAMNYLSIADVFSMPSYRETFGLVYLEAIHQKVPIVLCQNNGIDGIVRHKESAMIVPEHNVEQLVDSIYIMLTDKRLRKTIVEKSYEIVNNNYLWDQIGLQLLKEYKLLVQGVISDDC